MARRAKTITMKGSRGLNFIVCECHYELVRGFKWHVSRAGYVARSIWDKGRGRNEKMIYLHRFIMNAPANKNVDHRDTDPLNNCCWNLRLATQRENLANTGMWGHNISGFKGVSLHKQTGKWQAYINQNGRRHSLGLFEAKEEAAKARARAAVERWGEWNRV